MLLELAGSMFDGHRAGHDHLRPDRRQQLGGAHDRQQIPRQVRGPGEAGAGGPRTGRHLKRLAGGASSSTRSAIQRTRRANWPVLNRTPHAAGAAPPSHSALPVPGRSAGTTQPRSRNARIDWTLDSSSSFAIGFDLGERITGSAPWLALLEMAGFHPPTTGWFCPLSDSNVIAAAT